MLWQPSGFPHLYYIHPCQKCQIHFDRNCPGETVCVFAEGFPMIQPGTARLPRARSALAMTNLLALRHRIRTAKPTACMALTERRYRRNRFVRYYRRCTNRQCLPEIAASACGLLAMTSLVALHGRRYCAEICDFQRRSLPVKGTPHP